MHRLRSHSVKITTILSTIAIFWMFLYPNQDPDLGWHLRLGEEFRQTGQIATKNSYTWILPEYIWPNHSWGYDLLLAIAFNIGSFPLLSILAASLIAIAWHFSDRSVPGTNLVTPSLLILFFFANQLLNRGIKSQLISLVLTSILWFMLTRDSRFKKKATIIGIPVFFWAWSNLHGQFLLGIVILGVWITSTIWQQRGKMNLREIFRLGSLLGLSILATFVNPFGIKLWATAMSHLTAPTLAFIYEWRPWEFTLSRLGGVSIYLAFIWYVLLFYKRISSPQKLVLAILTLLAFQSRRHIPTLLILTLPYAAHGFYHLIKTVLPKQLPTIIRLDTWLLVLGAIMLPIVVSSHRPIWVQTWDTHCQKDIPCSRSLVDFLKKTTISGKIFNDYDLGGFLIYHHQEAKYFIDGRMTVWQNSNQEYPYQQYLDIAAATKAGQILFYQYNFDYAIVSPSLPIAQVLRQVEQWPVIYDDGQAWVLQNPNSTP